MREEKKQKKIGGKISLKILNVSFTVIQLFKSGQCYITRAAAVVVRSHLFISLKFKFHSFFSAMCACVSSREKNYKTFDEFSLIFWLSPYNVALQMTTTFTLSLKCSAGNAL